MDNIQIVQYSSEDRVACINLLKKVFEGTSDENTFKWRFESSERPEPLLVCAKHKNKVVSFLSWIPWEFEFNGKKYLGYQAGELATDAKYRGKGLAGKLFKLGNELATERNIDFFFSFPKYNSHSAFAHYKAGYFSIGNFYNYIKVRNQFVKYRALQNEFKADDLFEPVIKNLYKITPVFNLDYIKWRYQDNPKNYDIISYDENNNRAIFIIKKRKRFNSMLKLSINYATLVDCQFTSYDEIFIVNAFKYLERSCPKKFLFFTTFFNPNSDRGRALIKCFDFKIKSRFEMLCIKPINTSLDYTILCNINNWDILPHVMDIY